jgi:ribosomal-protein-alanine N-acetyltransferase
MTDIRPARPTDLDDVVALEARIFAEEAWSPRSIETEFAALGNSRVIDVAVDRGRLVAYAVLMYVGDSGDLNRIAVAETHRRLGVASRLMARVLDEAQQRGLRQVLLEVAANNVAALGLYAESGFVEIDRRAGYYPSGQDGVVMRRLVDTHPSSQPDESRDG